MSRIVLEVDHHVRACSDILSSAMGSSSMLSSPSNNKSLALRHLCLRVNLSSQLKQRPWARLFFISSQVRRFMVEGVVVFVGEAELS